MNLIVKIVRVVPQKHTERNELNKHVKLIFICSSKWLEFHEVDSWKLMADSLFINEELHPGADRRF